MADPHTPPSEEAQSMDYSGALFLIALIALGVQIYDVVSKQRIYQSRKTWKNLPNVHPYPDKHRNHAKTIRWLFYGLAISQTAFIVGVTVFLTVTYVTFAYGVYFPYQFLVEVLLIELAGVVAYRLVVGQLTRGKRRYILGNIAVWMGFTGDEGEFDEEED